MNHQQTAKLAVSATLIVALVGLSVRDSRLHKKRMQRLQKSAEEYRAYNAYLEDNVIPALDKQLETARYWDIVTRDM